MVPWREADRPRQAGRRQRDAVRSAVAPLRDPAHLDGRHVPGRGALRIGVRASRPRPTWMPVSSIPDEIVLGDGRASVSSQDDTADRGFVLDGFPRTVHQAESLDEILAPRGDRPRRQPRGPTPRSCCAGSPAGGSASTAGPTTRRRPSAEVNWTCDVCGGEVIQREDDTEGADPAPARPLRAGDGAAHRLVPRPGDAHAGGRGSGSPTRSPTAWSRSSTSSRIGSRRPD